MTWLCHSKQEVNNGVSLRRLTWLSGPTHPHTETAETCETVNTGCFFTGVHVVVGFASTITQKLLNRLLGNWYGGQLTAIFKKIFFYFFVNL